MLPGGLRALGGVLFASSFPSYILVLGDQMKTKEKETYRKGLDQATVEGRRGCPAGMSWWLCDGRTRGPAIAHHLLPTGSAPVLPPTASLVASLWAPIDSPHLLSSRDSSVTSSSPDLALGASIP